MPLSTNIYSEAIKLSDNWHWQQTEQNTAEEITKKSYENTVAAENFTTPLKRPIGTSNYLTYIVDVDGPWPKANKLERSTDSCVP